MTIEQKHETVCEICGKSASEIKNKPNAPCLRQFDKPMPSNCLELLLRQQGKIK